MLCHITSAELNVLILLSIIWHLHLHSSDKKKTKPGVIPPLYFYQYIFNSCWHRYVALWCFYTHVNYSLQKYCYTADMEHVPASVCTDVRLCCIARRTSVRSRSFGGTIYINMTRLTRPSERLTGPIINSPVRTGLQTPRPTRLSAPDYNATADSPACTG